MIVARDFSRLRGTLTGISDRALDAHLGLYRSYVDQLNAIEREYPRVDWTKPVAGQPPAPAGVQAVLDMPIAALKLKAEGAVALIMKDLVQEALAAGLKWLPEFYFGDDGFWTADRATSVNIPWYLANPLLWWLVNDRKAKYTEEEVSRAIRHEVGHAVGYAFELWKRPDWTATFGPFEAFYGDTYRADPMSKDHVRYLHRTGDKHYAQKHPDEDWAETFATWLDPRSHWRDAYPTGTGARAKLDYVEALSREGAFSGKPVNTAPGLRVPYTAIIGTVGQFLGANLPGSAWSPHSELLRREPYAWNAVRLHELFFEGLVGGQGLVPGNLVVSAAEDAFGSMESWMTDLRAACGSTSSGWALACWDVLRQRLVNVLVEDHRTGPLAGCPVLLAIDVWEHAYALDYGARKEAGIAAIFQNIDWVTVDGRLAAARGLTAPSPFAGGEEVVRDEIVWVAGEEGDDDGRKFAGSRDHLVAVKVPVRYKSGKETEAIRYKKPDEVRRMIREGKGKGVEVEKLVEFKPLAYAAQKGTDQQKLDANQRALVEHGEATATALFETAHLAADSAIGFPTTYKVDKAGGVTNIVHDPALDQEGAWARAYHMQDGKVALNEQVASAFHAALENGSVNSDVETDAIRVYLHEIAHGASASDYGYEPTDAPARPLAKLEEATTDVLAHHYTEKFAKEGLGLQWNLPPSPPMYTLPTQERGTTCNVMSSYAPLMERLGQVAVLGGGLDYERKHSSSRDVDSEAVRLSLALKYLNASSRYMQVGRYLLKDKAEHADRPNRLHRITRMANVAMDFMDGKVSFDDLKKAREEIARDPVITPGQVPES